MHPTLGSDEHTMLMFGNAPSREKREVTEVLDTVRAGSVPDLRRYYAISPASMLARPVEAENAQEISISELNHDPTSASNNIAHAAAAAPSASIHASGPDPNNGLLFDDEAHMRNILAAHQLLDNVPNAPRVHFRFNVAGMLVDMDTQGHPIDCYPCISNIDVVSSVDENLNHLKRTATDALTTRFPILFATIGDRSKAVFYVLAQLPVPNQPHTVIEKDAELKAWVRNLAKTTTRFQPVVEKEYGVSFPYDAEAVKTRKAAKSSSGVKNEDSTHAQGPDTGSASGVKDAASAPQTRNEDGADADDRDAGTGSGVRKTPAVPQTHTEDGPDAGTGTKHASDVEEVPAVPQTQNAINKCRFPRCGRELPNLALLRTHIYRYHGPDAVRVNESKQYECWWKGCVGFSEDGKASPKFAFASMIEWMDHVDEAHLH
ncbi:uncharacterized protein AB675_1204 [Cyphellophora attinorum]|uniref:C2H2-type domain-containing protein n=1 Tax=Cyphellophora attinorum TaxID=1664694 RepID=A0A0N1H8C3_9EURO|nr:uncharacterized protein AB675_1204 [Phialophora attinorum]KPI38133.1 hypothetical protein AB675_1204 [Phialophora attinorum]